MGLVINIQKLGLLLYQTAPPQQALDVLRDPIWQFIGAVLAIVAIAISLYIFWRQRSRKSLQYEIVDNSRLISPKTQREAGSKLQLMYDGHTINDLSILIIKIYNSGNVEIPISAYKRPIEIVMGDDSSMLEYSISETSPNNLRPSITHRDHKLFIDPLLLNPGDTVTIRVLFEKVSKDINVNVRIAGISKIERYIRTENTPTLFSPGFVLLISLGFILIIVSLVLFISEFVSYTRLPDIIN